MIKDLIKLCESIPTIRILLVARFPINNPTLKEKVYDIYSPRQCTALWNWQGFCFAYSEQNTEMTNSEQDL